MTDPLAVIQAALTSDQYPCPGDHRKDGLRGDYEDVLGDLMSEHGVPDDWDESRLMTENADLWKQIRRHAGENWLGEGECQGSVTIELEYDGDEYTTYCYPVASGACATAIGLDEMSFGEHPIFLVWWERRLLHRALRDAIRTANDERRLILETAS